jgi:adenylate cyclase
MGAVGKFAYTVIGDSVNLASRLEGANREYHTGIMVSERTYALVSDEILGRELDRIGVMGRNEPVTTYELLGPSGPDVPADLREFLAHYAEGKRLYYSRDWEGARKAFQESLRLRPDDYPALLHIHRAEAYMQTPPPDNWNGVFVMQSK